MIVSVGHATGWWELVRACETLLRASKKIISPSIDHPKVGEKYQKGFSKGKKKYWVFCLCAQSRENKKVEKKIVLN